MTSQNAKKDNIENRFKNKIIKIQHLLRKIMRKEAYFRLTLEQEKSIRF